MACLPTLGTQHHMNGICVRLGCAVAVIGSSSWFNTLSHLGLDLYLNLYHMRHEKHGTL
jgi:hypothetical protein